MEDEPLLYTVPAAARLLGLGRSKTYELIRSGRIRSVRIDGCRRIPRAALEEFIAGLEG
ncbi:helix-turn-helix domain-containing protein [uncultured Thermomonospora sp.]|uniref:helix-turn-helix domain-containing protein n=1 Tax=uncultured Thermomonospora sp. TaxID=671175 RepID=UPI00259BB138|nr:helix-turn-helix domain-containing protein [uncultured Thermomonospora sp.]